MLQHSCAKERRVFPSGFRKTQPADETARRERRARLLENFLFAAAASLLLSLAVIMLMCGVMIAAAGVRLFLAFLLIAASAVFFGFWRAIAGYFLERLQSRLRPLAEERPPARCASGDAGFWS